MKQRLQIFFAYYLYWLVFFVIQKPIFMLWQHRLLGDIRWQDWLLVPWHGLSMDWSVSSYIAMAGGLLLCVSCWVSWRIIVRIRDGLTALLLTIGLVVLIGDNGCFPSWGYHLDKTVWTFLQSPMDVLACAPWWLWCVGVVAFIVLWAGWWWVYQRTMQSAECGMQNMEFTMHWAKKTVYTFIFMLLTGVCFVPARGGLTVSTMNTGRVYYSDNQMLNMAAINPIFNILESAGCPDIDVKKYTYMSTSEAECTLDSLLRKGHQPMPCWNTTRPNIVFIVLESFSHNAMDAGAMPCLSRLAKEGIFFNNAYAGSYRTDRGMVCAMSACPGQPLSSLMILPAKSQQLPQLGKTLKEEGYQLHFYYGGDEDFTNMRSYLVQGGFEHRVADRSFPVGERLSKWGVPDHILLRTATEQICKRYRMDGGPYLDAILTLSSHEPFEVDYHHLDHPYLNSIAYTDSCVGALVDSLRTLPTWNNTIVALVADHGYPYPADLSNSAPARYRIPMLLVGGAIREPRQVNRLCSQIDLVPTILCQMALPIDDYLFSKDVLDTTSTEYAFYAFNDGFALIVPNDTMVVDAKSNRVVKGNNSRLEYEARAFVQRVMEYVDQL